MTESKRHEAAMDLWTLISKDDIEGLVEVTDDSSSETDMTIEEFKILMDSGWGEFLDRLGLRKAG